MRRIFEQSTTALVVGLAAWMTVLAPAAGQPAAATGDRSAYASAAALQQQGLYDLAADAWRDLLRKSPEGELAPRARYNLGVCRFHAGAFAEAAERFASVADRERFPDLSQAAWANLGLARLNAARTRLANPKHDPQQVTAELTKAVAAFDQGLAESANGNQATPNHFHRGEALALLGKPTEAAEAFRRVLDQPTDNPLVRDARIGLGNALLNAGLADQIAAAVTPVIEDKTAPLLAAEARVLRAEAALATDRPAGAAADFGLAAQTEGFVDAAYAAERAAFSWYTANETGKAAEAYTSLAERFPNAPVAAGARLSAGKCWLLANRPGRAAEVLAAAWQKNPAADNAAAARWWARALLDLDRPTEALAAARAALATKPGNAAPLDLLAADAMAAIAAQRPAAADAYEAFAGTHPDDPAALRALTQAAAIALEANDAARAKRLALRALAQEAAEAPGSKQETDARAVLAEASFSLQEWPPTFQAFRQLIAAAAADPRAPQWCRRLADAYTAANQPAEAITALSQLIQTHPDDPRTPRARYDRGRLLTAAGEPAAANADFQAAAAAPDSPLAAYALLALATNQHASKDYGAALQSLANAEAAPAADRLRLRALCLIGLQRPGAATRAVEACQQQKLPPQRLAELHHELAWMHRDAGRSDEALAAFSQAAAAEPEGALAAESLYRVGEIHRDADRHKEAATAFAAAARRGDGELREQALHLLGWSHYNDGQPAAAAEAFRQQLQDSPAGTLAGDAGLMLGESLFAQQKHAEALAAYRQPLQAKTPSPELLPLALLHAGQAAGQLGDWEQSLALLTRFQAEVKTSPLANEAAYERAWALHKLGRNAEAAPEFDRLAEQATGVLAARATFIRGELHFAAKQHALAVRMFYRVAYGFGGRDAPPEFHPWQAESLFEAARCLEQLNQVAPARKLYAELIERFPKSPKARLAEDRLPGTPLPSGGRG